jgi:hypothetical protein
MPCTALHLMSVSSGPAEDQAGEESSRDLMPHSGLQVEGSGALCSDDHCMEKCKIRVSRTYPGMQALVQTAVLDRLQGSGGAAAVGSVAGRLAGAAALAARGEGHSLCAEPGMYSNQLLTHCNPHNTRSSAVSCSLRRSQGARDS